MKILHVADVHLGASCSAFGELAETRRGQVMEAFRALPDVVAQEGVEAALFAGDLFDTPEPGQPLLATVRETLRRLVGLGVPVALVPGNHDSIALRHDPYRELARASGVVVHGEAASAVRPWPDAAVPAAEAADGPAIHIFAGPRFGDPVRLETPSGRLYVYGFGYDPSACPDPLSTFRRGSGDGLHVALLHASVHDAAHWSGSGSSLSASTDEIAELDVHYVALGDHHRPRLRKDFGGLAACYPGSFAAGDLTETGPRGYVVATIGEESVEVVHRDAGVPAVASVEVDTSGHPDEVAVAEAALRLLPAAAVPLVRLTGEPSFPLDPEAVRLELAERFGHAEVRDDSRYFAAPRLDELAERDTVAGHVVRLGRQRIDRATDSAARAVAEGALRAALRALEVDG